jgi:hypothetical protein
MDKPDVIRSGRKAVVAKRRNRFLISFILAAGMCCLLTGMGSATVVHAAQTGVRTDTGNRYKAEEYLSAYYGVEPGQAMTLQAVNGMIDNVIYDKTGMYSLHTFTLPEEAPAVAEVVARTAPELKTSAVEIYVNPAFVRYVTGEDRQ